MLARALVSDPDLLLLDEPTNHLDIDSIAWLEEFLTTTAGCTLLFVTHDRLFARRLATRIVDLDRGKITSWPGNYAEYLRRKDELLLVEAEQDKKFDKKLSQEEAWIRQGVKARRTRNQGRVRALLKIREERAARRNQAGKARMQLQEAEVAGKLRVRAENISYSYGERQLVDDFSISIMRGDKVGIIGPNGCGKTTLLQMLLGRLEPRQGTVHLGTNLQVAYYDQLRAQLDEERSVADNVGDGNDTVMVNDMPRHIIGYLKDFLFTPDRARSPVKILSGGERNRLLLAKLFSRPANLLVMDEPTNDLDVETLELLEELLLDYQGTVLLVSHDRAFLNNVVTSTLVFEGKGKIQEYAGGYDDWLLQRPQPEIAVKAGKGGKKKGKVAASQPAVVKLSFKEKQELADLPKQIETMENEQQILLDTMADPAFYQTRGNEAATMQARLDKLETLLETAFQRWEKLEAMANAEAAA
jgi:ATP-binding cassette subfamily F protein uup